ncbi:MAG TPA: arginine deiminase family protein [Rectinemataceae bacterium]|nr:arginine deiminase family protein [Rectinemataceae bacterium]
MPGLNVTSEIGVLRRVILHSPGPEVEAMTPKEAEADLYNDIIPLAAVRAEYDTLKAFLGTVAQTFELGELLAQAIAATGNKFEFLTALGQLCPIKNRMDELMAMAPAELSRAVIEGLPSLATGLPGMLSPRSFSMRPLPNTYFMRDSAAIFRDYAISGATAYDVRLIEPIITRFIFTHHPDFLAQGLLFDGPRERNRFVTIEGGDIIVIGPRVLAVGISERSSPEAVERLAVNAGKAFGEPMTVFAVLLPKERATIHLDMVFTVIDRDAALVYAPVVTGPRRARVLRLDARRGGIPSITEEEGLLQGLWGAGIDLEPIACGGGDQLFQEREQWWSGANSFAFAPGKIVMYSCNVHTLEALSKAGFAIKAARDFLGPAATGAEAGAGPGGAGAQAVCGVDDYHRLVVGFDGIELARGGGGARCMTLPVERADLD